MNYVLNTNSGILHAKHCADGLTGNTKVEAGSRKHYRYYENAIQDPRYKKNHNHPDCLGDDR